MARNCRFCSARLTQSFCDLGQSPLSNAFVSHAELDQADVCYPLHAWVCGECLLVQLEEFESPENIFSDYAYFSSYSDSWLAHCRQYVDAMRSRFGLGPQHQIVEIASNDGYLLQYFAAAGIPVLGIEPAANVAAVAIDKGIPTNVEFFGMDCARRLADNGLQADLLLGNNVLAHVPDINDFVAGLTIALKPDGIITMEFPHLLRLMQQNQFDTIYHEHFSYLSLLTVERIFGKHGLQVFDVDEITTHGGSLRIYARHAGRHDVGANVDKVRRSEKEAGLYDIETYANFGTRVEQTRRELRNFLEDAKKGGARVLAYGAPAKGNTLLNYCGIGTDLLEFTVDRNPAKQGRFLPGSHIPVLAPDALVEAAPDYVLILPWNLKEEIVARLEVLNRSGSKFVVPIPSLEVLE